MKKFLFFGGVLSAPRMEIKEKKKRIKCAVKICPNTNQNPHLKFLRFPKDQERAKLWAQIIQRNELKNRINLRNSGLRICSDHFFPDMFSHGVRTKLLSTAVPQLEHVTGQQKPFVPSLLSKRLNARSADDHLYCKSNATVHTDHTYHKGNTINKSSTLVLNGREGTLNSKSGILNLKHKTLNSRSVLNVPSQGEALQISPDGMNLKITSVVSLRKEKPKKVNVIKLMPPTNTPVLISTPVLKRTVQTQTESRLTYCVEKHKIRNLQRLLKKVNKEKNPLNIVGNQKKKVFYEYCNEKFPPNLARFVIAQSKLLEHDGRGFRYSEELKDLAFTIYNLSPKVYKILSELFTLPAIHSLRRIKRKLAASTAVLTSENQSDVAMEEDQLTDIRDVIGILK